MSDTNDVRLIGYCAAAPKLKKTKKGQDMLTFVVYTRSQLGDQSISQPNRCLAFGKMIAVLANEIKKGRHIYIRGMNYNQRVGEGDTARYYTGVLVEWFYFTPTQGMIALKDTIKEILEKENITKCEELDFFQKNEPIAFFWR